MITIMILCIIGTAVIVWTITKSSVQQNNISLKEESIQETTEKTIEKAEEQKGESINENMTENSETKENAKNSKENTSFDGEILGQVIDGPELLNGLIFSYMGIQEENKNTIKLAYRITNNTSKDVILNYKKDYYLNDSKVIGTSEYKMDIPTGKAYTASISFKKSDIRMSTGNKIESLEIICYILDQWEQKTDEKFSIVFSNLDIELEEE